jgi:hypothetical protein
MGEEELYAKHPKARGYLRSQDGYRLYARRGELTQTLLCAVRGNAEWLQATLGYPLAGASGAGGGAKS